MTDEIKIICNECSPKPDPRYTKKDPQDFLGHFIKKGFPAKNYGREHLWVRIIGFRGKKTLIGIIDNDPVDCNHKRGDKVRVTLKEIEDVHYTT